MSKEDKDKIVFHSSYYSSDETLYAELKYEWRDIDSNGILLDRSFFGVSFDGGPFIDVKDIIEVFNKRFDESKPMYRKKNET